MNNLKLILTFVIMLLSGCNKQPSPPQTQPISAELTITLAAHKFINSQISLLNSQYNMSCGGIGTSLYDGVKKLTWYFDIPKKLTKDEGRILIMDCVSQIVKNANHDSELKTFFNNDGFTQKNVSISILVTSKGSRIYYPEICAFGFCNNELGFHTKDPQKQHGYHTSEYESYDEVASILKAQGREDVLLETELASANHATK